MSKATRQAFGESLARLGETNTNIVVLDADLSKSTKSELFNKKFPDRFYEMGISEMNMIGAAAGLSFAGKLPFACSFGCFLTGRYDTIRLSVAYSQANVRLVGTHSGVGIGDDGHSQMGLEDVSLMRALPTMGVFQPVDATETHQIMDFLVNQWKGPAYLRLTRQALPNLLDERLNSGQKWEPTKPFLLRMGNDKAKSKITIFVSGAPAQEGLEAASRLESEGVASCTVVNIHCLKPLRSADLEPFTKNADKLVTLEDHSVIGGLGSAVLEALAESDSPKSLLRLGVQDQFGESGEPKELYEKFGLSADQVTKRIQAFVRQSM